MTNAPVPPSGLDRRAFLGLCSLAGVGHPAFAEALWREAVATGVGSDGVDSPKLAQGVPLTKDMVTSAAALIGISFTPEEIEELVVTLGSTMGLVQELRRAELPNGVPPALRFDAELPGREVKSPGLRLKLADERDRAPEPVRPSAAADLAFLSVAELAALVRRRRVTAMELTRLYLDRLKRHGPTLECVVTLTEERALDQAAEADRQIAAGRYRGPLHGIPWGAKDLFAVPGYPTTWGTGPFKDQILSETATVVQRLDRAGAVLVAKLTLGELAMGDVWFGGTTRNPWKPAQGSSGSSAGPGSATAAGLVGFGIGTETLGSIVSPADRNGVTGLRPTFGRVSRYGAMALSWSMDKVGPMCRSVEDCGLVFDAIHGPDGRDPTAVDRPFSWSPGKKFSDLRIGYLKTAFEADRPTRAFDTEALAVLRGLGVRLIPVALPADLPITPMRIILQAEAAAAFDELTRNGRDDEMTRQGRGSWPSNFRQSRFIPAVEYLNANRFRTLLMREMDRVMEKLDVFVTPSFAENVLLITNLTGHPCLAMPNGFRDDRTPVSISFIGKLFGEAELLAVGQAYQEATAFHREHPSGYS